MATARTKEVPTRYLSAGLEKMGAEIGQPSEEGGDGQTHTGKASGSACTARSRIHQRATGALIALLVRFRFGHPLALDELASGGVVSGKVPEQVVPGKS